MIYLSGGRPGYISTEEFGVMLTPYMGNLLPAGAVWGADSGCYTHAADFDLERYLRFLDGFDADQRNACLFATAPDVPYDAVATTERSLAALPALRRIGGYAIAFVLQDGHTEATVPWRDFDAIFVGGSVEWKTGEQAAALRRAATARGKWTHMGKVNTMRRIALAKAQGYDSVDGTCLKYGADINAPRLLRALGHPQMSLGRLGL